MKHNAANVQIAQDRPPFTGANSSAERVSVNGCKNCLARELALCSGFAENQDRPSARQSFQRAPARRVISHPREHGDAATFICNGWAISWVGQGDGSRQIVSILLPGDAVSVATLFTPIHGRTVEAVTEVVYRKFSFAELKTVLLQRPETIFAVMNAVARDREFSDQLVLDLGRRTSDQRVARLILDLHMKLSQRRTARGEHMEFPLRQRHIADATGLTPVHVCKVLGNLADDRYIKIADRHLQILDLPGLQRLAA